MASVLSTKIGLSATRVTLGKLGEAGAGCILQQQGAESEVSGEAAFFAQQNALAAFCIAAIMGHIVAGRCIWQASANRAGARKVVIMAKTSIKIVRLRNIRLPRVYPCGVFTAI